MKYRLKSPSLGSFKLGPVLLEQKPSITSPRLELSAILISPGICVPKVYFYSEIKLIHCTTDIALLSFHIHEYYNTVEHLLMNIPPK